MKKVVTAILLISFTATVAFAEWLVDFKNTASSEGIEIAVENALKAKADTAAIVENGLAVENVNPQNLIKALYCGGVAGDEVRTVAGQYNISEMIVEAGFQKSVAECKDQLADVQPFTAGNTQGPSFSGRRAGGNGGNGAYASPSTP